MPSSREEQLKKMAETVKLYEDQGMIPKQPAQNQQTSFFDELKKINGFYDFIRSYMLGIKLKQQLQGKKGAEYIKQMRELSGQKPLGEIDQ